MSQNNKYALIVISCPHEKAFEKQMLKTVTNHLVKKYHIIDLYQDQFQPQFEKFNLAQYTHGTSADPHVLRYQKLIKGANELIFIYSINFQGMDPMFKGFVDKTFLSNGFWYLRKVAFFDMLWGQCRWIKKTTILAHQIESKKTFSKAHQAAKRQMTLCTLLALRVRWLGVKMLILTNSQNIDYQQRFLTKIKKRFTKK